MRTTLTAFLLGASLISSCQKDDQLIKPPLTVNTQFDTSGMAANTLLVSGLNRQIANLTTKMKTGRVAGQQLVESDLLATWQSGVGDSVLANKAVTPLASLYPIWLRELAKASGSSWTPGASTGEGGVYGSGTSSYLFDETGLEMEQMVEKSQFAGTQFRLAIQLLQAKTPENIQKALVLFGAPSTFPNSDKATNPDRFAAAYAARRDKNDGLGFYSQLKQNFLVLQAAAKAGDAYNDEYQTAFAKLKSNWERALMATVINYCYSASTSLAVAAPGPDATARALHALGEAIGFTYGMKAVPANDRIITDNQIDAILTKLNAPPNGPSTVYKFATEAFQQLPMLDDSQGAIGLIKSVYGFTDAEIVDFRQNWVSVQSR